MSPPRSPSWAVLNMLAERPAVQTSVSIAMMPPQISAHLMRSGSGCAVIVWGFVITRSVAHGIVRGSLLVTQPLLPNRFEWSVRNPSPPVLIRNREYNFPMPKQCAPGIPQRVFRVVDIGLRGGSVQFHDFEIFAYP